MGGRRHRVLTIVATLALSAFAAPRAVAQGGKHASAASASPSSASAASVRIVKPKARTVSGGGCRILGEHSLSGSWGPSELPTLAFVIGPASAMADQMHASKAAFTGPGKYKDVIVAVYLGKTALEDSYMGLGTITVNPDRRTGSFALNDGSASGTWDCGVAVH